MEAQIEYEMEQNNKVLLPKLYRVWKTLNKMMEDRGYIIEENYSQISYQDWLLKHLLTL